MTFTQILKKLLQIFEKKKVNPISLDNDSNLDSTLKPITITGKPTPLQVANGNVNINGTLKVNGVDVSTEPDEAGSGGASSLDELSDVSYSSGDLTISSLDKIVATNTLEIEASGSSDISFDSGQGRFFFMEGSTTNAFVRTGSLNLIEQSNAHSDSAGYGQIWVKNDTPNNLYFTNDAGTDIPITNNGVIANQKFFIKSSFFHGSTNSEFIPLAGGSTIEVASLIDFAVDDSNFIVPYNLKINTIYANVVKATSSTANPGNTSLQLYKDGSAYSGTVIVNLSSVGFDTTNLHTVYTWDFSGETNTYSAGEVMQIEIDPTSTLQYVSITVTGEYT